MQYWHSIILLLINFVCWYINWILQYIQTSITSVQYLALQVEVIISLTVGYKRNSNSQILLAAEFVKVIKDGKIKVVQNPSSLKDYITSGLSINSKMPNHLPRYVSFIVQRKFDTAERHDKVHLNFHMSVFTVRSCGRLKDGNFIYFYRELFLIFILLKAVYYNPSPKYFTHKLQPVPVLESFTHKF